MNTLIYLQVTAVFIACVTSAVETNDDNVVLALFSIRECQDINNDNCSAARNEKLFRRNHVVINEKYNRKIQLYTKDISQPDELLKQLLPFTEGKIVQLNSCIDKSVATISVRPKDLIVVTQLTFQLTRLASAVLISLNIPLFAITFQPMYPAIYLEHNMFIYSFEASFANSIHLTAINRIRQKLNITYSAVFNINNGTQGNIDRYKSHCDTTKSQDAFCVYITLEKGNNVCLKEEYIDIGNDTDIEHALRNVELDPRLASVVLYGENDLLRRFRYLLENRFQKYKKQKILYVNFVKRTYKRSTTYYTEIRNIIMVHDVTGETAMNELFFFMYGIKEHVFNRQDVIDFIRKSDDLKRLVRDLIQKNKRYLRHSLTASQLNVDNVLRNLRKLPKPVQTILYDRLRRDNIIISQLLKLWKSRYYLNLVSVEKLYQQKHFNPNQVVKAKSFCHLTKPTFCNPGKEIMISYYKEINWDNSYGWNCHKCKEGFYKYQNDTSKCQSCQGKYITDNSRTKCYDPYTHVYLRIDRHSAGMILIALFSAIQFTFILATYIVFLKNLNTPVVKLSNIAMSTLQLFMHLVLTMAPIFVFTGIPNTTTCTLRPLFIGMAFTVTLTINIGKTQKVLLIYKSKTRMSSKEIILTKATEWFIIAVMLLVDVAIIVISLESETPTVKVSYDEEKFARESYCSNNSDVLVQFIAAFILVFFNGIQGIRARKLPSEFREVLHLTFSSFTSSVLLIASTCIYFSQRSQYARTMTLLITVYIMNFLHFALMYVYKVFIILCRPHLNTKKAFDEKRLKKMENKFHS